MELELILAVLSRWAHVGAAIVLVGGSVFMRFVLMPAAEDLSDAEHEALKARVIGRWKKFVHVGIALFLISGFYNFYLAIQAQKAGGGSKLYHPLIGTKILLAFVMFFLASRLVGRSNGAQAMRQNAKKWVMVIVVLAGIVVAISGVAKVALKPNPAVPAAPE